MTERTYLIPQRDWLALLIVGRWPRDGKGRARKRLRSRPFLRVPSGAARVLCRTGFRRAAAVSPACWKAAARGAVFLMTGR